MENEERRLALNVKVKEEVCDKPQAMGQSIGQGASNSRVEGVNEVQALALGRGRAYPSSMCSRVARFVFKSLSRAGISAVAPRHVMHAFSEKRSRCVTSAFFKLMLSVLRKPCVHTDRPYKAVNHLRRTDRLLKHLFNAWSKNHAIPAKARTRTPPTRSDSARKSLELTTEKLSLNLVCEAEMLKLGKVPATIRAASGNQILFFMAQLQYPESRLWIQMARSRSILVRIQQYVKDGDGYLFLAAVEGDRRREIRFPVDMDASLVTAANPEPMGAKVTDVSISGMCVSVPSALKTGMHVTVYVENAVIFGEVRYCDQEGPSAYRCGIMKRNSLS